MPIYKAAYATSHYKVTKNNEIAYNVSRTPIKNNLSLLLRRTCSDGLSVLTVEKRSRTCYRNNTTIDAVWPTSTYIIIPYTRSRLELIVSLASHANLTLRVGIERANITALNLKVIGRPIFYLRFKFVLNS